MKQFMQKITATVSALLIALIASSAVPSASFSNAALAETTIKAEPAAVQPQIPQRGTLSIIAILIGLVQRQVAIYVPNSYQPGAGVPLVFALHGGGGDASKMYDPEKRIVEYAESRGFIAVFPNGLPRPDAPAGSENYYWGDPVNIGFMNQLIDLMTNHFTIDSRRVYFVGFSGGAKLCYQLAADPAISARIAAIATVAGDMGSKRTDPPTSPWEIIDPAASGGAPMSALLLQGGEDRRLPAMGGFEEDFSTIKISFQAKVDSWRLFVGAPDGTSNTILFGAPARVESMRYTNPATGNVVISALDPALPHKWPEWNFMGAIWDFFEHAPTR
jgi:poly(3-hydroxybutyrate) depolymerase